MPTIEITQEAFDALRRETERFNMDADRYYAEHPDEKRRAPATMGELASDVLTNHYGRDEEEDDPNAEPVPF